MADRIVRGAGLTVLFIVPSDSDRARALVTELNAGCNKFPAANWPQGTLFVYGRLGVTSDAAWDKLGIRKVLHIDTKDESKIPRLVALRYSPRHPHFFRLELSATIEFTRLVVSRWLEGIMSGSASWQITKREE